MNSAIAIFLCVAAILIIDVTSQDVHHSCVRPQQGCQNGGNCDIDEGNCTCTAGFDGFACQQDLAIAAPSADCSLQCQNMGECYTPADGSPDFCLCTADYIGMLCETNRVAVDCDGLSMSVSFTPIEPFSGLVFLGTDQDNTSCSFAVDATTGVRSITFGLDEDFCESVNITDDNNDSTFRSQMNIHYSPVFVDTSDLVFNVSCFQASNNTRQSVGNLGQTQDGRQQIEEIQQRYEPARLAIANRDDFVPVSGPVTLGDRVILYNFLDDSSVFKAMRVEECVATDPQIGVSLTIIRDGCPTAEAASIFFTGAVTVGDPNPVGISHEFKIFSLRQGTRELQFTCRVTICRATTDAECQPADCSSFTPLGRRRRAADGSVNALVSDDVVVLETDQQITTATVQIVDPNAGTADTESISGNGLTPELCADEPVIKTALIVLGVSAVLLLIVCVILSMCLIRQRSVKDMKEMSSYGNSESVNDSPSWFHLPRVTTR